MIDRATRADVAILRATLVSLRASRLQAVGGDAVARSAIERGHAAALAGLDAMLLAARGSPAPEAPDAA